MWRFRECSDTRIVVMTRPCTCQWSPTSCVPAIVSAFLGLGLGMIAEKIHIHLPMQSTKVIIFIFYKWNGPWLLNRKTVISQPKYLKWFNVSNSKKTRETNLSYFIDSLPNYLLNHTTFNAESQRSLIRHFKIYLLLQTFLWYAYSFIKFLFDVVINFRKICIIVWTCLLISGNEKGLPWLVR